MDVKQKIVIVGGGFAGLQLVRRLDNRFFEIILIDKLNHHQFQPLFYQVATSQIEPSSISFPLRHIFRKRKNVMIRLAEVLSLDLKKSIIKSSIGEFKYDYLVLAMGCKTNFFGNNEISKYAFTLKTTYDAITIRNHILQTFEDIISANGIEKESLMNIVIVGGGPTGVEMAGAFSEIKKNILPKDYHRIDFSKLNIFLIEGSKYPLNSMSKTAKNASKTYLQKMGVELLTEKFVVNYNGEILQLNNGETIKTKTVIWAAGVTSNTIEGLPENSLAAGNRIKVDRINKITETENVFAIGDIAYMETPLYPKGHPQLANVAINQAKNLAKNLKKIIEGEKTKDYEYKDLGSMATLGRNKAVVDLPFIKFKGFFAWIIWMFLHLMLILSVRNKLIIFINWAWAYITKDTSLRLILKGNK
ncbi:MAG: NAD(P)/FAD-dependent oxidoreductase [Bacteroidales bacterium]|nr:NAD(P)/FAD-dependent oxidoreductase [Bacteroidales bacterium]MBN2755619.1 NAD(P)/FAD-dependent oxidoreductase [Bacteroidales bacterium]